MYIKTVIIDGFKSYGQRTEIKGFDPLFNAITGLNGTGKSNILDSICFLLGITNLTHVRATNMQELIYKNGQAGVTKATVTIIFDNADKSQSPLGYEQSDEITITRQIVLGGKNKYLINGSNVPNSRIQDLFQSVQLNVNNPHFLIMQGRVTKVLNMKPPEILSMIEEAAGTRMYETKKQSAVKTIEKKDAKLREINAIIDEEITPALDKLKGERAQYFQFQKTQRDLELLTKLHAAYTYTVLEAACEEVKNRYLEVCESVETLQTNMANAQEEIKPLEQEIEMMSRKRQEESGPLMQNLELAVSEKHKAEAKVLANVKNITDSIKREEKRIQQLIKSIADDQATLDGKEKVHEGLAEGFRKLKEAEEKGKEVLASAQKRLQAISSGMFASEDGQFATIAEQLMAVKESIAKAETERTKSEMKLKNDESEYQKKSQDVKKIQDLLAKDQQNYKNMESQIGKIKKDMEKCNYDEAHFQRVEDEHKNLREEINQVRHTAAALEDRIPQLRFNYTDPEPNFDHSSVKGLLCKLFSVKEKAATLALEVTAGGKLCNVVVDTERTGKKLLEKGQLERRVTFIPLNKIQPRYVDQRAVKIAESLVGKENVQLAMDLVEYNDEVKKAVGFAFGSTFICKDMNVARTVAFHKSIMTKCVTLEGDVVDPGGVITGGFRAGGSSLLAKLPELMAKQDQLSEMGQRLKTLENELRNVQPTAQKYLALKKQYESKAYEFDLMKQCNQETSHQRQAQEVQNLVQNIGFLKETITQANAQVKDGQTKVKDLEYKMKNADTLKAQELNAAKKAVEEAKKQAEDSRNEWKAKEQEAQTMTLELEELRTGIQDGKEQLRAAEDLVKDLGQKQIEANSELDEMRTELAGAQEALQKAKEDLEARSANLTQKVAQLDALKLQIGEWELEVKRNEHVVAKAKQEAKDKQNQLTHIVKKHPWIQAEKQHFGEAGSWYDFKANNAADAGKKIQQLEESNEKMRRTVNMQAMNMLDEAEEKYKDLVRRKKIVEKDKLQIQSVIAELDEKKKEALMTAWGKVNIDFGSIFSNLLPGTNAKLSPPQGQTVLDGLEVRVSFGGVWKESLSELSGGQRSLVALSLILALLLFKPAPIYILDEVDAALDLSHTQNIGQMLKTHFKRSQFIVVSLKDGMFNNANVLFRTKFVDGVSAVTRSVQK